MPDYKPYYTYRNKLPFRASDPCTFVDLPPLPTEQLNSSEPTPLTRYLYDLSHLPLQELSSKYPLHCPPLNTIAEVQQFRDEFLYVWFEGVDTDHVVSEKSRHIWLYPNQQFDDYLTFRYQYYVRLAIETDQLAELETTPYGIVVYSILMDYIPRRIYRGTSRAFSGDEKAERLALKFLDLSWDFRLPAVYGM
jgi:hypothetical protein